MMHKAEKNGQNATPEIFTPDLMVSRKHGMLLNVTQLRKKLGLSIYLLNKLESKGLIRPKSRTRGGHRRYHEDQLPDIRRIIANYKQRSNIGNHVPRAARKVPVPIDRDIYDALRARAHGSLKPISINHFINEALRYFLEQKQVKIEALIDQDSLEAFIKQGTSLSNTLNEIGKALATKQNQS